MLKLYGVHIMKRHIKDWLGVSKLEKENAELRVKLAVHGEYVTSKVSELKEYTRVDADVGIRGNNTIILTGVYRRKAYVRFYDLGDGEFVRLVEQLKAMRDHALIRNIDAPPSFKGIFDL